MIDQDHFDAEWEAAGVRYMDRAVETLARELCGQRHHLPLDDLGEPAKARLRAEAREFTETLAAKNRALLEGSA